MGTITVNTTDTLEQWRQKTNSIGRNFDEATGNIYVTGNLTLLGSVIESVYSVSGTTPALDPKNGTIQTWTLTGSSTPTISMNSGESLTLMVDDGSSYTITWSSINPTWKTDYGSAPTLNTTGYTVIVLWKVSSTIYGARVGNA